MTVVTVAKPDAEDAAELDDAGAWVSLDEAGAWLGLEELAAVWLLLPLEEPDEPVPLETP